MLIPNPGAIMQMHTHTHAHTKLNSSQLHISLMGLEMFKE